MRIRTTLGASLVLAFVWLTGCSEGIPPVDLLAQTQGAIRAAEEAGAEHEPQGQLHIKLAHEQLDKAKTLMDREQFEEATRLLLRSSADADVARAYARKQTTTQAADAAQVQLDKLKGQGK